MMRTVLFDKKKKYYSANYVKKSECILVSTIYVHENKRWGCCS